MSLGRHVGKCVQCLTCERLAMGRRRGERMLQAPFPFVTTCVPQVSSEDTKVSHQDEASFMLHALHIVTLVFLKLSAASPRLVSR